MKKKWKYIALVLCGFGVLLTNRLFSNVRPSEVDIPQSLTEKKRIKNENPRFVPQRDVPQRDVLNEEGKSPCKGNNCILIGTIIPQNHLEDTGTPEAMILQISVNSTFTGYVSSQLCSVYTPLDEDNTAEIEIFESCDIFVYRMDGAFRSYTEEQFVEYQSGMEKDLYFEFPESEYRVGGMGVSIGKVEEGFEIFHVYPDTPAEQIGLQTGDIIVEVNGESTYDLQVDDFIQMTTGRSGTQAEFRLYGDESERPRIFTRAPLDL
jgi:hypothetical protein